MNEFNEWQETILFNLRYSTYIDDTPVEDITIGSLSSHLLREWDFDGTNSTEGDYLIEKYISEITPRLIMEIRNIKRYKEGICEKDSILYRITDKIKNNKSFYVIMYGDLIVEVYDTLSEAEDGWFVCKDYVDENLFDVDENLLYIKEWGV